MRQASSVLIATTTADPAAAAATAAAPPSALMMKPIKWLSLAGFAGFGFIRYSITSNSNLYSRLYL